MGISEEYLKSQNREMSEEYLKAKDSHSVYFAIALIPILTFIGYKIATYDNVVSITERQDNIIFWSFLVILMGSLVLGIIKKWMFKIKYNE